MRVNALSLLLTSLLVFSFFSCGSTPKNEISKDTQAPKTESEKLSTQELSFLDNLNSVIITEQNKPKETFVNKAFNSSFSVTVTDAEGNAVKDFALKVIYINNSGDEESVVINTNESGICEFDHEVPAIGMNSNVTFLPYTESNKQALVEACNLKKVEIPCKVKGKIYEKGAILFVWDYNEKDRPLNNSYDILSEIRNRGIRMAGNAPVSESYYFDRPLSDVYKQNKDIVGNMYGYLIVGQVKFVKPVELVENEYLCSLVAEINVIDMSNGDVAFTNTFTNDAFGSNWTKCVTKCKKELAGKIIDSIIYDIRL